MKHYSIEQAIKELGITKVTLYRWITNGWIAKPQVHEVFGRPFFTDNELKGLKKIASKIGRPKRRYTPKKKGGEYHETKTK